METSCSLSLRVRRLVLVFGGRQSIESCGPPESQSEGLSTLRIVSSFSLVLTLSQSHHVAQMLCVLKVIEVEF